MINERNTWVIIGQTYLKKDIMQQLNSHTHLQGTQINAQPKLTNKSAWRTYSNSQESTGGNTI